MRPRLRPLTLTSLVTLVGCLVTFGPETAKAQLVVSTPGVTVGLGAPYVPVYPRYAPAVVPVTPVVPVVPVYRPVPVRPRPFVYSPGGFYGPRPVGPRGFYGYRGGYRRW